MDVGYSRQYQPSSVSHGGAYSSSSRWASTSGYGSESRSGDRGQRGAAAGAENGEAGASGQQVVIKEVPVVRTVVKEVPQVVVKEVPTIVEVEKVVFPDVAFQFDSDKLTDLGKGKVYLAAQMLKDKSGVVVVIEGHADRIGTDEYNMALGLRRAETVKKELEVLGIGPDTVSVVSVGEARPLIDQETDWARAVNRRVELRINPN